MLAGDQHRRTFDQSDPAQDAVRYVCLGSDIPEGHGTIPALQFVKQLTRQSSPKDNARMVCELRSISRIAGTLPVYIRLCSETDLSGTESTAGLKGLNTFLTGRDNLIKEANALQLTLSESWVSFMSSSFT